MKVHIRREHSPPDETPFSATDDDSVRAQFIRLRQANYKKWVLANAGNWQEFSEKIKRDIRKKWAGFYPDPFPFDDLPPENGETNAQDPSGSTNGEEDDRQHGQETENLSDWGFPRFMNELAPEVLDKEQLERLKEQFAFDPEQGWTSVEKRHRAAIVQAIQIRLDRQAAEA
jgi:hypothetical protein